MLPAGAHAEGAIALGVPDDVAKQGLAFGRSWNVPNVDDAKQRAMEECKTVQGAPPATRKLCKVVATYENQCAAIALDNKAGTPGWGYAIGDTKEEAEEGALRNCQKTAGTERRNSASSATLAATASRRPRKAHALGHRHHDEPGEQIERMRLAVPASTPAHMTTMPSADTMAPACAREIIALFKMAMSARLIVPTARRASRPLATWPDVASPRAGCSPGTGPRGSPHRSDPPR